MNTFHHPVIGLQVSDLQVALRLLRTGQLPAEHPLWQANCAYERYCELNSQGQLLYLHFLAEILVELLLETYQHYRRIHNLILPNLDMKYDEVTDCIQADAQHHNPRLVGASLLFHRYARADLDFDAKVLIRYFDCTPRTGRRYQYDVLKELTRRLLVYEMAASERLCHDHLPRS